MLHEFACCHVQQCIDAGPVGAINHLDLELCHCINQTGIALMQLTQLLLSFLCHSTSLLSVCLYCKEHPMWNM